MKQFKIEEGDSNQRLDKFLKKLFPRATRSLIYKFTRNDKIKIKFEWSEGKFKKRDNEYKLQIWDEIKIFLSDEEFEELAKIERPVSMETGLEKIKLDKKTTIKTLFIKAKEIIIIYKHFSNYQKNVIASKKIN